MATVTKALVSSFARFVQGDIKGGEHAHAYRKEIIANAIEQAYKGNYEPINEAKTLTEGKAKKARAYYAGFATLGTIGDIDGIKKVHYIGALNANENKSAREEIANKTAASVGAFFVAFDEVMAEKAEKKPAKTAGAAAAASAGDETAASAASADQARHDAAVSLDESVTRMEVLARAGELTGEQVDRLALAALDAMTVEQLLDLAMTAARRADSAAKCEASTAALIADQAAADLAIA